MIEYSKLQEVALNGMTPKEASEFFEIKYPTLLVHWKRLNLPMQGSGGLNRLLQVNPFECWTEEAQYWFGYILGDGNISKVKYSIAIYSQDLEHLKKYQRWLHPKMTLNMSKNGKKGTVLFGHKQTHEWFIKRGIVPNKSLIKPCSFTKAD